MIEEGPLVPEGIINQPELAKRSDTLIVYIPGFTGGGSNVTDIRRTLNSPENLLVVSSISHRHGLKKGEKSPKDHFNNIADQVVEKLGEKERLVMIGHSFGGSEMLDIVDRLILNPRMKAKKVELVFVAVPGFTERGLKAWADFAKRFPPIHLHVTELEQDVVYPLPEAFYERLAQPQKENPLIKKIWEDKPEKRAARRQRFVREWAERIIKPNDLTKLTALDQKITQELKRGNSVDQLILERQKLLAGPVQALFRGEHIDQSLHQEMYKRHQETLDNLAPVGQQLVALVKYIGSFMGKVRNGIGQELVRTINKSKENGIELTFALSFLEKDQIIKPEDIESVVHYLKSLGLADSMFSSTFTEISAHSSHGLDPSLLVPLIQELQQESQRPHSTNNPRYYYRFDDS